MLIAGRDIVRIAIGYEEYASFFFFCACAPVWRVGPTRRAFWEEADERIRHGSRCCIAVFQSRISRDEMGWMQSASLWSDISMMPFWAIAVVYCPSAMAQIAPPAVAANGKETCAN